MRTLFVAALALVPALLSAQEYRVTISGSVTRKTSRPPAGWFHQVESKRIMAFRPI